MSKDNKVSLNPEKLEGMARDLDLPAITTEEAIEIAKHDILLEACYRKDKIAVKAREVYREWYKNDPLENDNKVVSAGFHGPPGHGKTTAFKKAAQAVSSALGLIYVENPPDTFGVNQDAKEMISRLERRKELLLDEAAGHQSQDLAKQIKEINEQIQSYNEQLVDDLSKYFLFVSQEFAGETSSVALAGIVTKVKENDLEYMGKLFMKRFLLAQKAGMGLILCDDLSNATPSVQNAILPVLDERRFQGLDVRGVYVSLTGNLGSLDGTNTFSEGTAQRGRAQSYLVYDTVENFNLRSLRKYKDSIGDCGVATFLELKPDAFSTLPDKNKKGGFEAPRNWENGIRSIRHLINSHGGMPMNGETNPPWLSKLNKRISAFVGPETGLAFHSFMKSMLESAIPLAADAMLRGRIDEQTLQKRLGAGHGASSQEFQYQYGVALAQYAAIRINNDNGKIDEAMRLFARALLKCPMDSVITHSVNELKKRLANQFDHLADPSSISDDKKVQRKLSFEVKKQITMAINSDPQCRGQSQVEDIINALTDLDKSGVGLTRKTRTAK